MTEQTENATRLARPLIRLAKLAGVATSYVGMSRDYHEIEDDVLVAVLKALGIDASNDDAIEQSITTIQRERNTRIVPPTVLHIVGKKSKVEVHGGALDVPAASITLEDGETYAGKIEHEGGSGAAVEVDGGFVCTSYLVLPEDLPEGYHTLEVTVGGKTESATVISAPEKIELLDEMKKGSLWGWMSQLYSIRSSGSWGIGDYEDLKTLLVESKKKTGADFMLINPLHAAEPVPPIEPSPYLPISRRFINFSYIRPESMPEYAALSPEDKAKVDALHEQVEPLNGDAQVLDRETMWRTKMQALWIIYKAGLSAQRQAEFDQYLAEVGDEIESYATWCLCYDKWGASNGGDNDWVRKYNRDSEEVAQLRAQYPDTLEFYRWLEWVATEQLHAAQQAARDAGMKIGIVADMAVGVHPAGSDVWWNPERFAKGATVGAPPDMFNQQGQDWSQPPLNPIALDQTGYKVYRDMVHGMFSNAGAVRIDHILGLFRLWWIPEGRKAMDGTYVHYDSDIMLGILALEASRAGGVVVGMLAAIMGVGGGFVTFPMFVYIFGVSSMTTVGTDILQIIFTAGLASVGQYAIYGYVFYTLAVGMLLGSLLGIQVGALTTKVVKGVHIRGFYAVSIISGFINRAATLPKKLVEMEYLDWSMSVVNTIESVGNVIFWAVVAFFGLWVFSKFFLNLGKLRGEA